MNSEAKRCRSSRSAANSSLQRGSTASKIPAIVNRMDNVVLKAFASQRTSEKEERLDKGHHHHDHHAHGH